MTSLKSSLEIRCLGRDLNIKKQIHKVVMGLVGSRDIKLTTQDKTRGLKFPTEMNSDLAEEIGIHVGDGCMHSYVNNYGIKGYQYTTTSGLDEMDYVKGHLVSLIKKVYGLETLPKPKKDGSVQLHYGCKSLVKFKMTLGLPLGRKDNIVIPECVLKSDFILDFLRGLMDTDGCLCFLRKYRKVHYYPRLAIGSKSKKLILQVDSVLRSRGFKTTVSLDDTQKASNGVECTTSRVVMNGKKNLRRWINLIGFSNPKNIRKLEEWNAKGFIEK